MTFHRNLEEIQANPLFMDMPALAASYGLCSRIVEVDGGFHDENKGIYFVTGTDDAYICGGNIDIREINNLGREYPAMFVPSVVCIPLDEVEPYAAFVLLSQFCKNVEAMREGWKVAGEQPPRMMTTSGMETLKTCFESRNNASTREKEEINNIIRGVIHREKAYLDPTHPDYKKKKYELKYYDWAKGKLANWWRRTFHRHPNRMSLASLAYRTPTTLYKMVIQSNKERRRLEKELKKHPQILYAKDKTRGIVGARFTTFYFEAQYERDVENLLNRIDFDQPLKYTPDRLLAKYGTVCDLSLPNDEYPAFATYCADNRIEWCVDEQYKELQPNCTNIVFPQRHQALINAFLMQQAAEHAKHLVPEAAYTTFELSPFAEPQIPQIKRSEQTPPKTSQQRSTDVPNQRKRPKPSPLSGASWGHSPSPKPMSVPPVSDAQTANNTEPALSDSDAR